MLSLVVLDYLNIDATRIEGKPGVYVNGKKIASIGLKYTRGFCIMGLHLTIKLILIIGHI